MRAARELENMSNIEINHPANPAPADEPCWDTAELQRDFVVEGFGGGCVVVTRKSDGVRGSLEFNGSPRVYHSFQPA